MSIINANCDARNETIYKTEVLISNLCDYEHAYILVRGDITVTAVPATQGSFKTCAPFTKCITKTDETTVAFRFSHANLQSEKI